jgi:vacuolar protein sorting-associated protein 13A/C
MVPQNFKFNNFILKERNYKMIFRNKDYSYNFIFKVERDPKFFYLTRLVAVPALSFKNDMPFPCELFISNGVQKEVLTLKQGQHVKMCDFNILNDVTFMAGILRPEVFEEEEQPSKKKIIQLIKSDPFKRYYFKSKGKLILQNGHLGQDYKKVLSLYNDKEERTYFSMVRWITPDSYFGFLLYSDSAIINETPYRLHFRSTDISNNKRVSVVPQMESLGFDHTPQSLVTLLSSKRSTLEVKLRDAEKNKMLFFSTKFSNKITTSGLVNGVFIINMQKQKGKWVQSERHIPKEFGSSKKILAQSMFPGVDTQKNVSKMTIENSKIGESQIPGDLTASRIEENFHEMFPSSDKIKTNKMYLEIGYKVSLVYSKENKGALATKVVHLCPKTIVSNETDYMLIVQQKNSEKIGLSPESKKPIYAFVGENGKNKLFKISLVEDNERYQSKVEVDFNKGGSISLIMMNDAKNKWKIVRVEMLIEDSYMFVKVSDRTGKEDMIIKNNIDEPIRIYQHKYREDFSQVLMPGEIKEMAWVNPYKDQKIHTEILEVTNPKLFEKNKELTEIEETKNNGSKIASSIKLRPKMVPKKKHSDVNLINLKSLKEHMLKVVDEMEIEIQNLKKAEVKTKHNRRLTVDIKLVHHSRMIEIETEEKHKDEKQVEEVQDALSGTSVMTCLIRIGKMGLSLVAKTSRVRRELFYLYVNGTNFFYEKEGPNTSIQFQIRYLNIDNNYSSQCRFPVLFTCGRSLNEMVLKDQYMINCILKMIEVESDREETTNDEQQGQQKIMCFDEITLELSPLTMTFEWSIIRIMTDFKEQLDEIVTTTSVSRTYLSKYFLSQEQLAVEDVPNADLATEWESKNIESSVWIYCNRLNISCLKFVVTFNMNKDESGELSKSEDSYINVVVNTLGGTLLNIDESPLSFNGIKLYYVFESSNGLISLYKQHLLDQAKINVMRLLGSFDILGNPTNLFGNVGDGVVQFFEKPVEGFKKGPISGIKGIAKGSTALLKNTAAGTLNAISKFTGSLASGLTILSNDKTYQRQRNLKKAKKPKGVTEGLKSGAQSIGKGVWSGVTGIVTQPIKEVKKSGAIGIFKGLFKGITGVVTKPLGGLLDATSQTTEGIKKTITKNDDKANEFKQRPPRVFYTDKNVIKVYDNEHAKRIKALVKVDPNMENESLIDSVQLSLQFKKEKKKCILVITNNYFVILNESLSKIHISCEILDVKKVEFELKTNVNGNYLFFLIYRQTFGHWQNFYQVSDQSERA